MKATYIAMLLFKCLIVIWIPTYIIGKFYTFAGLEFCCPLGPTMPPADLHSPKKLLKPKTIP